MKTTMRIVCAVSVLLFVAASGYGWVAVAGHGGGVAFMHAAPSVTFTNGLDIHVIPMVIPPNGQQIAETLYMDCVEALTTCLRPWPYMNFTGDMLAYADPAPMTVDDLNLYFAYLSRSANSYHYYMNLGALISGNQAFHWYWEIAGLNNNINGNQIGAALIPNANYPSQNFAPAIGVLAYKNENGVLQVDTLYMPTLQGANFGLSPIVGRLTLLQPSGGWSGNVSIGIRREGGDGFRDRSNDLDYALYIATMVGPSIAVGTARIGIPKNSDGTFDPSAAVAIGAMQWQTFTPPRGVKGTTVDIQASPDGRVLGTYTDSSGYIDTFRVDVMPAVTSDDTGNTSQGAWKVSDMGVLPGLTSSLNYSADAPAIAYAYGKTTNYSGTTNAPGSGIQFPVNRVMYLNYTPSSGYMNHGAAEQIGSMIGMVLPTIDAVGPNPQTPYTRKMLVGIIEGMPPVPHENIDNCLDSACASAGNTPFGETTFGFSSTSATDSSVTWKHGGILKLGVEAGEYPQPQMEAEVRAGVGNTNSTSDVITNLTKNSAGGKISGTSGAWTWEKGGVAFVYGPSYTGYRMQFVDMSGQTPPGAADYTQIYASAPTIDVVSFDFDPDASTGIIPGELMTYVGYDPVAKTSRDALLQEAAAYTFTTVTTPYIEESWSTTGTVKTESEFLHSQSQTDSVTVDAEATIGWGAGHVGGGWSIEVGGYMNFESDTTVSTTSGTSIATTLELPSMKADNIPTTYTRYTYHVFTLAPDPDNKWSTELLTRLRTYHTEANQDLLTQLLGANPTNNLSIIGNPWKITYAIPAGDFHQCCSTAAMPPSLRSTGIRDERTAASVHRALHHPPTLKPDLSVSTESRALAARLNPQQRADLDQYIAARQRASIEAFMKRHPKWQPPKRSPKIAAARPKVKSLPLRSIPIKRAGTVTMPASVAQAKPGAVGKMNPTAEMPRPNSVPRKGSTR